MKIIENVIYREVVVAIYVIIHLQFTKHFKDYCERLIFDYQI